MVKLVRNALQAGTPASSIVVLASNVLQLRLVLEAAQAGKELPGGARFQYEDTARHLADRYLGAEEARKVQSSSLPRA